MISDCVWFIFFSTWLGNVWLHWLPMIFTSIDLHLNKEKLREMYSWNIAVPCWITIPNVKESSSLTFGDTEQAPNVGEYLRVLWVFASTPSVCVVWRILYDPVKVYDADFPISIFFSIAGFISLVCTWTLLHVLRGGGNASQDLDVYRYGAVNRR